MSATKVHLVKATNEVFAIHRIRAANDVKRKVWPCNYTRQSISIYLRCIYRRCSTIICNQTMETTCTISGSFAPSNNEAVRKSKYKLNKRFSSVEFLRCGGLSWCNSCNMCRSLHRNSTWSRARTDLLLNRQGFPTNLKSATRMHRYQRELGERRNHCYDTAVQQCSLQYTCSYCTVKKFNIMPHVFNGPETGFPQNS